MNILVDGTKCLLKTLSQTFIVFLSSKSGNCVYICRIKNSFAFQNKRCNYIVLQVQIICHAMYVTHTVISLSTLVLNSRDWSEIVWLPEISRFKINLAISFI